MSGARPRIRIDARDVVGHNTRIYYITDDTDDDGNPIEIEISNCVTAVDFHADIASVNHATLNVILTEGRLHAEVEDVIVRHIKPRPRRWWEEIDVTHFGSRFREWIRA